MKLTAPPPEPSAASAQEIGDLLQEPLIVEFPTGIPGFEACRRFVLIASADLSPLGCLKAVDSPEASFLVIDPTLLYFGYDVTLSEVERARIDAAIDDPLLWLAIVTVTGQGAIANLRAPVVINPRRMVGSQFIRDRDEYPVEFSINLG
jgi:flagellar assembly factor FliW